MTQSRSVTSVSNDHSTDEINLNDSNLTQISNDFFFSHINKRPAYHCAKQIFAIKFKLFTQGNSTCTQFIFVFFSAKCVTRQTFELQ